MLRGSVIPASGAAHSLLKSRDISPKRERLPTVGSPLAFERMVVA